ncbi:glycosyltransferase [Celerinatantimonas yamalensis]|uniref:Glycosyltransferase n=1 Tax=Celerinatantimonas yamalensis TaxID=559956 RepID=A0ABW9G4C8_9GAMM
MEKKVVVISGQNCTSGGILSIYEDFLLELSKKDNIKIFAIVNSKKLFKNKDEKITYIEIPKSKKSWLLRLFYEYIWFYFLSKKIKSDLWISMHDITPNVKTKKLITYCHNPSPFYKFKWTDFFLDWKFGLFTLFYSSLYSINIKKNDHVIVQQVWIKKEFEQRFNINNVIVSKPANDFLDNIKGCKNPREFESNESFKFFYPSYPRVFKNFEVICEAVKIIESSGDFNFSVLITVDGYENRYANKLYNRYGTVKNIIFSGLMSREEVFDYYNQCDVLIFPSKLETWGLPISEFKAYNKPMILANEKYTKETIAGYDKVILFESNDAHALARIMINFILKNKVLFNNYKKDINQDENDKFVFGDWISLIDFIV